jgi:hypothetical protein
MLAIIAIKSGTTMMSSGATSATSSAVMLHTDLHLALHAAGCS